MATWKDLYDQIQQGKDAYAIMDKLHIKPHLFKRILRSRRLNAMLECQAMLGQKLAVLVARAEADRVLRATLAVALDEYARPETIRKAAGAVLRYGGENPYRKMSFTTKTEGEFTAEAAENAEDGKREEKNRFATKSTKKAEKNSKSTEGIGAETQRLGEGESSLFEFLSVPQGRCVESFVASSFESLGSSCSSCSLWFNSSPWSDSVFVSSLNSFSPSCPLRPLRLDPFCSDSFRLVPSGSVVQNSQPLDVPTINTWKLDGRHQFPNDSHSGWLPCPSPAGGKLTAARELLLPRPVIGPFPPAKLAAEGRGHQFRGAEVAMEEARRPARPTRTARWPSWLRGGEIALPQRGSFQYDTPQDMLRFDVYKKGELAGQVDLSGAYVFQQDGIPVRADLAFADGQINCLKRVGGPCGLALLWDAGAPGALMLPTTRLPDRKHPYILNLELARARVKQLVQKREDWGLFDYEAAGALGDEYETVRQLFVRALQAPTPAQTASQADECLAAGLRLGEKMSLFHADVFLRRRRASSAGRVMSFGCRVDLPSGNDRFRERLLEVADFISLPTSLKLIGPKERTYRWEQIDDWVNWAYAHGRPIHAGPLVSFDPMDVPDWLYIWEHDYEALREILYEHIQRVLERYERKVRVWRVASGLHAYNSFNLSFEQIMELTRMSCSLVKKLAPKSAVIIDLVLPWGEYYARNQRTVPPLLYADMAVQSGIKFDGFGLQLYMGVPRDGLYVRDLLQVSSLLDEFLGFGVPLHVSAVQVPSDVAPDAWDAWSGRAPVSEGGRWHHDWNPRLQAEWLQAFCRVALSKPYVETICWRDLADYEGHYLPHGGLCRNDLAPKLAFRELRNFRAAMASLEDLIEQQDAPEEQ